MRRQIYNWNIVDCDVEPPLYRTKPNQISLFFLCYNSSSLSNESQTDTLLNPLKMKKKKPMETLSFDQYEGQANLGFEKTVSKNKTPIDVDIKCSSLYAG